MTGYLPTLEGKTLFITGGSRGIGLAIALRAARDGANVTIAAKTTEPQPMLPGTIYTAAEAIRAAGGQALPLVMDIREDGQIQQAVAATLEHFGGIDILINNASAISLSGTLETPMKRFDLMHQVNLRGTYATSQACLPALLKADNPHILNLAPPLDMDPRWFSHHGPYTMAKYGMSMCVLGMAEEFREQGVAVNALWPRSVILTAAITLLGEGVTPAMCRRPEIVADAAHVLLLRNSRDCSGHFYTDEAVLAEEGVSDFSGYAVEAGSPLLGDLFLEQI